MSNIKTNIASDNFKYSLLVGALAGLGFALGNWGIEAVKLVSAHGMYPLAKILAGGLACILVGLLAGWLIHRLTPVLAHAFIWALAAAAFNRLALYISFPGMGKLLSWLDPQTGALVNLAMDYGVTTRATLMLIIMVVAGLLAGLLANSFVEEAATSEAFRRWLALFVWMAAFIGVGVLADSLNQKAMHDAVSIVNDSIQFSLEHADEDLPIEVQVQTGMRGLRPVEEYLNLPYRLIPAGYDQMMVFIRVLVKFDDKYALCSVINNTMGTCMPVEDS